MNQINGNRILGFIYHPIALYSILCMIYNISKFLPTILGHHFTDLEEWKASIGIKLQKFAYNTAL